MFQWSIKEKSRSTRFQKKVDVAENFTRIRKTSQRTLPGNANSAWWKIKKDEVKDGQGATETWEKPVVEVDEEVCLEQRKTEEKDVEKRGRNEPFLNKWFTLTLFSEEKNENKFRSRLRFHWKLKFVCVDIFSIYFSEGYPIQFYNT